LIEKLRIYLSQNKVAVLAAVTLFVASQLIEFLVVYLYRFNIRDSCNWDCGWYHSLVSHGYDLEPVLHPKGDAANWAFFPAFPLLARGLHLISALPADISLIIIGKLFFLGAIFAFIRFGRAYRPDLNHFLLGGVVAFNPYSIYGNTGYTEPLFLFGSCVFFFALKKNSYVASGLIGGFLSSVRVVGASAALIYALVAIPRFMHSNTQVRYRIYIGLLFVPLGLAVFMLYLYLYTGDALAFSHIQVAWGRELQNPLMYLKQGFARGAFEKYLALTAIYGIACSAFFAGRRHFELALFSAICTLLPLSTGLHSLPRYVWWQAPVLLATAMLVSRRQAWLIASPASIISLAYMYYGWFSGKDFVI
jgi:hypothetical protein